MQIKLTTGERLTDLRREHNLTLEQVSEQTGIGKSTLSNYENDRKPDINLGALEKLAALYGVGLDYLLGLNENKKHSGTSLADLHLSDDAVDVLSSGKINNRLLSELITHPEFARLMADMEIYVDGISVYADPKPEQLIGIRPNRYSGKVPPRRGQHTIDLKGCPN